MKKINLKTLKLDSGSHKDIENGMCVMEAVSYFANEPFSDKPKCSCPVLTSYMIILNDSMNDKERQQLKSYIKKLIGTSDGKSNKRLEILVKSAVCEITPHALILTKNKKLIEHAYVLKELKNDWSYSAAESAARNAARSAAESAARNAARSAAESAARSADIAARSAAWSAARSAAWSAAESAAESAARSAAWSAAEERQQYWDMALKALDKALNV